MAECVLCNVDNSLGPFTCEGTTVHAINHPNFKGSPYVEVFGFEDQVVNQIDPVRGTFTKQTHEGVKFTTNLDHDSVFWKYKAAMKENIDQVSFHFFRADDSQVGMFHYFTIELYNVRVVNVKTYMADLQLDPVNAQDMMHLEMIHLRAKQVKWIELKNGSETMMELENFEA